jgi:hypothetical protein
VNGNGFRLLRERANGGGSHEGRWRVVVEACCGLMWPDVA